MHSNMSYMSKLKTHLKKITIIKSTLTEVSVYKHIIGFLFLTLMITTTMGARGSNPLSYPEQRK